MPNSGVAVFGFTSPNAASFLATVSHGVVKIGGDVGAVSNLGGKRKPKMTTIQEVKLFLTTFAVHRCDRGQKRLRDAIGVVVFGFA